MNEWNEGSSTCHSAYNSIYLLTEQKNAQIALKLEKIGVVSLLLVSILFAMYPIFYAILKRPTPDQWQLPFPMKLLFLDFLPFSQNFMIPTFCRLFYRTDTYSGFYAAWLEQLFIGFFFTYMIFSLILFYIGLCLYVNAIVTDFKFLIDEVNAENKMNNSVNFGNVTNAILKDAIILHTDMIKYCLGNHFVI